LKPILEEKTSSDDKAKEETKVLGVEELISEKQKIPETFKVASSDDGEDGGAEAGVN
jgi:hypothetical protein